MRKLLTVQVALLTVLLANALASLGQAPKVVLAEPNFDFGKVVRGEVIEHEFAVRNAGDAPLKIKNVSMTGPLRLTGVKAMIPPGEEALVKFILDTSTLDGEYNGRILLHLSDPATPEAELRFAGLVVMSIEVAPKPFLAMVTQKGKSAQATLELVSHEDGAVEIVDVQYPKERLDVKTETVEAGRRYRLSFTLNGQAESGRKQDSVIVRTTSKQTPKVEIPAFTFVRERVYTFPDLVDLGDMRLRDIRDNPRLLDQNAQTLMVYQLGGKDFSVNVRTDVPGLLVTSERGPKGDRFQITAKLERASASQIGSVEGNIYIETNDKEFPKLVVPVKGRILR